MKTRLLLPIALAALVIAACGITEPRARAGGFELHVDRVPQPLALGTNGTIETHLTNLTDAPRTLTFASSCAVIIHVTHLDGTEDPGGPGCRAVISPLTLAAHDTLHADGLYYGGAPVLAIVPGVPLAAGRYLVWAEVAPNEDGLTLRTPSVSLEVR